ncbi:hypothetical protein TcWFU_006226 [Taenia crassiceps]|uniref:Secreted protein n=1 Tax=Taenia crassiceps TaxID=6207 RepID=A0ABR4QL02_9CEST
MDRYASVHLHAAHRLLFVVVAASLLLSILMTLLEHQLNAAHVAWITPLHQPCCLRSGGCASLSSIIACNAASQMPSPSHESLSHPSHSGVTSTWTAW